MNLATWIAIYMPLFIIFFIVVPEQRNMQRFIMKKRKKRKELTDMTNELIKKYVGKNCLISTGSFGSNVQGEIVAVNENWIEIKTKKNDELVNIEFVQSIKIISSL